MRLASPARGSSSEVDYLLVGPVKGAQRNGINIEIVYRF